jgi:hypothetical protein
MQHIGEMKNAYKILVRNLKGRDYLEGLGTDGKIGCNWLRIGTSGGLDKLGDYYLLYKDFTPWSYLG